MYTLVTVPVVTYYPYAYSTVHMCLSLITRTRTVCTCHLAPVPAYLSRPLPLVDDVQVPDPLDEAEQQVLSELHLHEARVALMLVG